MISIIIPSFNRRTELAACLDSIIEQRFDGLEVIVVDDCSTDGTDQLQTDYAQWGFIRWSINAVNKGVNYSRNRAIEMAERPYILFLDSDDELAPGSLQKVVDTILNNSSTQHFLFTVSDRAAEFESVQQNKEVTYGDWITGRITGDFTHVIKSDMMKRFPFFEQFRMYEHLNWLRVKKLTSPQLLVPVIVANRERNRPDSLTNSMKLQSLSVIQSKFESEHLFYSMYYPDLKEYNPSSLGSQLVQAVALAAACNQKKKGKTLLQFAKNGFIRTCSALILLFPYYLVKYGIIRYSLYKSKR